MSESNFGPNDSEPDILLATTWWSFGRDRRLLHQAVYHLEMEGASVHDSWSDPDLNRTLIAFSSEHAHVGHCLVELADLILPSIDLQRHSGSHPRTGALDEVRLTPLSGLATGIGALSVFGELVARRHDLPIFADGPSSDAASEGRILGIQSGGFGGLYGKMLDPNYGPPLAHEQYGATVVKLGPLQLQAVLELADPTCKAAKTVADRLEELRFDGDALLVGVQAEGFAQPTRGGSLLLFTFMMPDENYPDQVIKVAEKEARIVGAAPGKGRALGIWPMSELDKATRLTLDESRQVWNDIFI